jgi:hypothetical protein
MRGIGGWSEPSPVLAGEPTFRVCLVSTVMSGCLIFGGVPLGGYR